MTERRLLISFSGGETSALMAISCHQKLANEYDVIRTVFSNTGEEWEQTLQFVHYCDLTFKLGVTWIEAVTPPERGIGARWREVTFATASRQGEPFEGMIQKHGIPGPSQPRCSDELKGYPIRRWARDHGWLPGTYDLAIGIRADEMDRVSPSYKKNRVVYPLLGRFPHTKPMVNEFWSQQPYRLALKGYQGNCKWCWKKSLRKLLTIMKETPDAFAFPERMERLYPHNGPGTTGEPRRFFRDNRLVADLRELAERGGFVPATDDHRQYQINLLDWLSQSGDADLDACGSESCEVSFAVE